VPDALTVRSAEAERVATDFDQTTAPVGLYFTTSRESAYRTSRA